MSSAKIVLAVVHWTAINSLVSMLMANNLHGLPLVARTLNRVEAGKEMCTGSPVSSVGL